MPLLNKRLLQDNVTKHKHEIASDKKQALKELFQETLSRIENSKFKKEESEKVPFLQRLFELLGYKLHENLEFEYSTSFGRSIDGVLGLQSEKGRDVEIAIEWKGIDTKNLDKGKAGETPVSQMWDYMGKMNVEFGIIGNFLEWRLYSKRKGQTEYQEYFLRELTEKEDKLDEFIFLLKKQTLLKPTPPLRGTPQEGNCLLQDLINQSEAEQEQITKRFYNDYKQRRLNLFEHLVENNEACSQNLDSDLFVRSYEEKDNQQVKQIILDGWVDSVFIDIDKNLIYQNAEKSSFTALKDPKIKKFVCEKDGKVVGYLVLDIKTKELAFVGDFYIDRKYRKQGIGKFLFDYGLNFLKQNNFKTLKLYLDDDNLPAKAFYTKIGFLPEKASKYEWTDENNKIVATNNEHLMELDLEKVTLKKEANHKHTLLEKAQKILDRLIFVMFCEDGFLLPSGIFRSTFNLGKNSRSRSETKIWEEIQYLFEDIDKGRYDVNPQINGFNGGLFAEDTELNNLIIKDNIWQDLIKLAEYDFQSDLNVNILGHIFEQSISDIEEIKAEIEREQNFIITQAKEKDLDRIFEIKKQDWLEFYTNNEISKDDIITLGWTKQKQNLKNDFAKANTWVLEKHGIIVGYILVFESEIVEIDQLYFDPLFIGKGLGYKLLSFVLNYFKPKQKDFFLEVVSYNQKAISFYEKVGFAKTNTKLSPTVLPSQKVIPAQEMFLKWDKIPEEKINKPKTSKRKKDGIYYTPEYITDYIVSETVGGWLVDQEKKQDKINQHNQNIEFLKKEIKEKKINNLQNFKIEFFASSQCNDLYLITKNDKKYLARITNWEQNKVWKIKQEEYEKLNFIKDLNIAPISHYYDLGQNEKQIHWSLVDFVEGETVQKLSDKNIVQLAQTLKKLHENTIKNKYGDRWFELEELPYKSYTLKEYSKNKAKLVEKIGYDKLKRDFENINWAEIKQFCLIHNDLKPLNMVENNGEILLIDWEYAYMDIPENDIARFFVENSLTEDQKKLFLENYLPLENLDFKMEILETFVNLYEFFEVRKDVVETDYNTNLNTVSNPLQNIKILDPAGGSGAFPNQAFNFLTKKWVQKMNQIAVDSNLETLADFDEISIDKSILKNNIFMVDLQPESVEIAKLSLWLKTAKKDQKLNNLDENVKVGNSLIDDPEIAGDKAFDWEKEFGWLKDSGKEK